MEVNDSIPSPVEIQPLEAETTMETDNTRDATFTNHQLADDIGALKTKILELESLSKANRTIPDSTPISDEMQQYQRMERCLYKHRKEWHEKIGAEEFIMTIENSNDWERSDKPWGPWSVSWGVNPNDFKPYVRPDPFDPDHQCQDEDEKGEAKEGKKDVAYSYDDIVDYGNRRDRLRKAFEWEMDRLYLVEETDFRKRQKLAEAKDKRKAEKEREQQNKKDEEESGIVTTLFAKPKLNRVDWFGFEPLAKAKERASCVIDILIGDPVIDKTPPMFAWFYDHVGFPRNRQPDSSRTAVPSSAVPQVRSAPPGHAQLPERIRIHSTALVTILRRILLSKGLEDGDAPIDTSVIVLRPFKWLVYCEETLRGLQQTLQLKFNKTEPKARVEDSHVVNQVETTPAANESGHPSQDIDPTAQTSAIDGGQKKEDSGDENREVREKDDSDDITQSETALEHLTCLLDFFDSEISKKRDHLRLGSTAHEVFFSDLWHLFQPGTEVIRKDGKQAYKVLSVTTAAPPWFQNSVQSASKQ